QNTIVRFDADWTQVNPAGYLQSSIKPVEWLKLTAGLRYDHFFFENLNNHPSTALPNEFTISRDTGGFRPRGGIGITPVEGLTFFANAGQGISAPVAGSDEGLLGNPGLRTAELTTFEVGFRYDTPNRLWNFGGAVYHTQLDGEVLFNPVTGQVENFGKSRREGFELEARYNIYQTEINRFSLYANFSMVRARWLDRGPVTYITGVRDYTLTTGFEFDTNLFGENSNHLIRLAAYNQYFGPAALFGNPADAVGTDAFTETYHRVTAKISYTKRDWHNLTTFLTAVAYPASRIEETAFGGGVSAKPPVHVEGGIAFTF
ncbi:MAG: TonB-dependent receptor domain-containing protein, partial [Limisphaerales bacterium]